MKNIKAVLFDYDGTLMDTNNIIIESWQHTFRTVKGVEKPEAELYCTFGEILHDTMERFFPDEDVEKCVDIYRSYQVDCYEKLIELFPGMQETVRQLKKRGVKTAIVTSRLLRTTMQGVDKYGLADCFDTIVTCDDTEKHKPDPDPALLAIRRLGIQPEEALMVGDTVYDIVCGNRAGAKTALVSWSAACGEARALCGEEKPDFIIDRAEELLELAGDNCCE
ncbi:HAD-IA family hydrolase [Bacilliculturomica massiliensis]|uniref:HAD-IA family hydrolase n=1 Tax=Bacilliculturomica massiliensis TaxID=1917867 RepID=UPI0010325B90|nr:HAD-IA family hydrolase [Bacilliculturomica massiliensis]